MTRSPEEERPSDDKIRFHTELMSLLRDAACIEYRGQTDIVVFAREFYEWKKDCGFKPTGFAILGQFPCIFDHKRMDLPQDTKVLLGFITDSHYLAIDQKDAYLQDRKSGRKIRDADSPTLFYYFKSVNAAIQSSPKPFEPTFSES
ncbi:MAG: hypothetical protein HYT08_01105 [Candidatus Levybacteria bacterium]|nr:hypothetical protein [Candidatus Levybacteria bacterium]